MSATTTKQGQSARKLPPRIYQVEYDKAFGNAVAAVDAVGWRIKSTDKSKGVISAKTPVSMRTWGDTVVITVHTIEEGAVRVDLSSRSHYQIVDWGKNRINILGYFEKLDNLINGSD